MLKIPFIALLIISSLCIGDEARLQPLPIVVNRLDLSGSELQNWNLIGPFKSKSPIDEASKDALPDQLQQLRTDSSLLPFGNSIWETIQLDGRLDFNERYGVQENGLAYVVSILESDEAKTQSFLMGVNDEAKVWINGELVIHAVSPYRLIPDEFQFNAELKSGPNLCVTQVRNRLRSWDFTVRTQPQNSRILTGNLILPDGAPASWAQVSARDASGRSAQTSANNTGEFSLVIPGQFKAPIGLLFKSGYHESTQTLNATDAEPISPAITLYPSGSITGRVLSKDTEPVSEALLTLYSLITHQDETTKIKAQQTWTDETGAYEFRSVKPGSYQVKLNDTSNSGSLSTWSDEIKIDPSFEIRGIDFFERNNWLGHWTHFTGRDGLASMANQTIFQDKRGFIWFGSGSRSIFSNGASRYDGKQFYTFPIRDENESNSITSISETEDGTLWFGTLKGLRYLKDSELQLSEINKHLPNTRIRSLEASNHALWIGTDAGLVYWNKDQTMIYTSKEGLPHSGILDLELDDEGVLWVGTKGGAAWFDGQTFHSFTGEQGLLGKRVETVHISSDQAKWFGTEKGVTRYHDNLVEHYSSENSMMTSDVFSITSDSKGCVWVGTKSNLFRIDHGHLSVLPGTLIRKMTQGFESILTDRSGNVWIATGLGGVYRYQETLQTMNESHGLPGEIIANTHLDKTGNLWIGTQSGLSKLSSSKPTKNTTSSHSAFNALRTFHLEDGLPGNRISVIESDGKDGLWIGTGGMYVSYDGLAHFQNGVFSRMNKREGIPNGRIHSITPSKGNGAWIGTANGFCQMNQDLQTMDEFSFQPRFSEYLNQQDINPGWIYDIIEGEGNSLWLATSLAGVFKLDENKIQHFTTSEGLPSDRIQGLTRDREGQIWLATFRGISRYDGKTFQNVKVAAGFPDHRFEDALCDTKGTVWFASWGSGVFGFDGKTWTQIDETDGLADNRVFTIEEDQPGLLHFSTANGLTSYQPGTNLPTVSLLSIQTDKGEVPIDQLPVIMTNSRVSLKFGSIDFSTEPEKRQYRFRVHSLDSESPWGSPQQSDTFEWIPSKPGTTIIEAQTIDRDLNYSPPIKLEFTVIHPWYRDAWIMGPVIGIFFGITGTAFIFGWRFYMNRRNSRKLERQTHRLKEKMLSEQQQQNQALSEAKEEADRANRAKTVFLANMSHEIRTPMNAILGYAQILTRDAELNTKQRGAVHTIAESGKHLLGLINDILDLSKIEAEHVKKEFLDFNLRDTIKGLSAMFRPRCQAKGLEWKVLWNIDSNSDGTAPILLSGDETKLRQILINLVSNAIKFTKNGSIELSIQNLKGNKNSEDVFYEFQIRDTGCGIPLEEQPTILDPFQQGSNAAPVGGTGLGLAIVKRHIELLGGKLNFESTVNQGTRFKFNLPFQPSKSNTTFFRKKEMHSSMPSKSRESFSALIIDDVEENREVLSQILTDLGAQTKTAESGKTGLSLLKNQPFDIVFLDIRMPKQDGFEIIREIRQAPNAIKNVKTVAISASTFTHEETSYQQEGFDSFVSKPFLVEDLVNCLQNLLGLEFSHQNKDQNDSWSQEQHPPSLPDDLLRQLREAAESYQTTEFKELLDQVRSIGPKGEIFADHLSKLATDFDMKQIIRILNKHSNE